MAALLLSLTAGMNAVNVRVYVCVCGCAGLPVVWPLVWRGSGQGGGQRSGEEERQVEREVSECVSVADPPGTAHVAATPEVGSDPPVRPAVVSILAKEQPMGSQ